MRPAFLLLTVVALSCTLPAALSAGPDDGERAADSGQRAAGSGQRAEEERISAPCTLHPARSSVPAPCPLHPARSSVPAPCPLHPAPSSSGRGLVFGFDLLTENPVVEANVSDPAAVSASMVVIVRNNGTAPLSVRLSATINLGGRVRLDPPQTPLLLYQATTNVVVSVTLPENTTSDSMGYLHIEGVCDQNPTVTYMLQIRLTIKQWHKVSIQRFSISTTSPLEREMVTLNARVANSGNGPSSFAASVLVDGRPLKVKIDGFTAPANYTVSIASGRIFSLAAAWPATYGHHNFVVEVRDVGSGGDANASEAMSKDTKVVSVFVGWNFRDLIPFVYITIIVLVAAALAGYRYRRKLALRLRRLGRRLRRLPPEEGDEVYEDDEDYEDDEYDDEEYDDEYEDDDYEDENGEYEDEEDEEGEEGGGPPPKKAAALRPKGQAGPVKRAPAPKASAPEGKPEAKGAVKAAARPAPKIAAKPPAGSAAGPAPKPGVILVGEPGDRPAPKGRAGETPVEIVEEE